MRSREKALRLIHQRKHGWSDPLRSLVAGGSVVCIASGPSLTAQDVALVQAWRERGLGRVFVANTSYRAAPWADLLFAIDAKWWQLHGAEVAQTFQGASYAMKNAATTVAAPFVHQLTVRQFFPYGNTGAGLVALAMNAGASRVVMLGYDCQHTEGRTHWHGDHPAPLGNAGSVAKWGAQFAILARVANHRTSVVNASRQTALAVFPRAELEQCLLH